MKNKIYKEDDYLYIENYHLLPKKILDQILEITAKNQVNLKVGKNFTLMILCFKGIEEIEKLVEFIT